MNLTQIIGIIAGLFTSFSMLPQLIKVMREKKAENVSLIMLLVLLAGLALWIVYGLMRDDVPIIATNAFAFLLNITLVVLRIKYAGKKESAS